MGNFCQSRISPSAKNGKAQTVSAHIMLENACESSKLREGPKKWGVLKKERQNSDGINKEKEKEIKRLLQLQ